MKKTFAEGTQRAIHGWVLLGWAAILFLPWYAQQGSLWSAEARLFTAPDAGNGLVQAALFGKAWIWTGIAGLALAGGAALLAPGRRQGAWLCTGAMLALVGLLGSAFLVRAQGWAYGWAAALFGTLAQGQAGLGAGAVVVLLALLMILGAGIARLGFFRGDQFVASAVVGCAFLLVLFVAYPVGGTLLASLDADDGHRSFRALAERLLTRRVWGGACLVDRDQPCGVAWNTLFLAMASSVGTVVMGTMIALLAERGNERMRRPLNVLALLPIITPPFVLGLGLILLFGRAGLFNAFLSWAFGINPTRWFYGVFGVMLAQLFAFTPISFMIMRGAVRGISPSLEEAAQTLRASRLRTFLSVTLPLLRPALANAFLVAFIESITDFGNPIVVGGQFSVLSTEIYFAIVGAQFDQATAASLSLVLTVFALSAYFLQRRVLGNRNFTTLTGKGDAGLPMPLPRGVYRLCQWVALPWILFTVIVYVFAFSGGVVKTWGRDYTFTLGHFARAFRIESGASGLEFSGLAWDSLWNSIKLAAVAAPACAAIGLLIAWLLARNSFRGQRAFEFVALLAFAIPGTVLGISYVISFNVPPFELTGTALIIVLCFVVRSLPVGVRAGTAAFKQLDRSLDEASIMLRASTFTTLRRIVFPLLKPALSTALVYSFVRSMTTVSAVVFLVNAENELSTTYIIRQIGNGDYGVALAYCTALIVLMSLVTVLIRRVVGEARIGRRGDVPLQTTLEKA
jgi:iron(III) transport system permease protein